MDLARTSSWVGRPTHKRSTGQSLIYLLGVANGYLSVEDLELLLHVLEVIQRYARLNSVFVVLGDTQRQRLEEVVPYLVCEFLALALGLGPAYIRLINHCKTSLRSLLARRRSDTVSIMVSSCFCCTYSRLRLGMLGGFGNSWVFDSSKLCAFSKNCTTAGMCAYCCWSAW